MPVCVPTWYAAGTSSYPAEEAPMIPQVLRRKPVQEWLHRVAMADRMVSHEYTMKFQGTVYLRLRARAEDDEIRVWDATCGEPDMLYVGPIERLTR